MANRRHMRRSARPRPAGEEIADPPVDTAGIAAVAQALEAQQPGLGHSLIAEIGMIARARRIEAAFANPSQEPDLDYIKAQTMILIGERHRRMEAERQQDRLNRMIYRRAERAAGEQGKVLSETAC